MNFPDPHHTLRPTEVPAGAHTESATGHVDAIVANALGSSSTAVPYPTASSRAATRSARRADRASRSAHAPRRSRGTRGGGMSSTTQLAVFGVLALLVVGGGAVASGAIQLTTPSDLAGPSGGSNQGDNNHSFYHDTKIDSQKTGPKWDTDRLRSTDPDEVALGDTSRWEYEGAYRYGPYGSDGMSRRADGAETTDPLYSSGPAPLQDVFTASGGDLTSSGGDPVGMPPSSQTNPYYDPYAGYYSNPYANRIRMAYGEGTGRGAAYGLDGAP